MKILSTMLLAVLIFMLCGCHTCPPQLPPEIKYVVQEVPKPPVLKEPNLPIDILGVNPDATIEQKLEAMYNSIIILEGEVEKRDVLLNNYRQP